MKALCVCNFCQLFNNHAGDSLFRRNDAQSVAHISSSISDPCQKRSNPSQRRTQWHMLRSEYKFLDRRRFPLILAQVPEAYQTANLGSHGSESKGYRKADAARQTALRQSRFGPYHSCLPTISLPAGAVAIRTASLLYCQRARRVKAPRGSGFRTVIRAGAPLMAAPGMGSHVVSIKRRSLRRRTRLQSCSMGVIGTSRSAGRLSLSPTSSRLLPAAPALAAGIFGPRRVSEQRLELRA